MAAIATITQVAVVNNPAPFAEPVVLDVQYECINELPDDLEWKIIYVGSAESENYDQVLDSAYVGPVARGSYRFRMEAPAPDPSKVPKDDLVGVTALLLTCSYKTKEFVRVGYYVNNEYTDPALIELVANGTPPDPPLLDKLQRNILADHPRVTKFPVDLDDQEKTQEQQQDQENMQPAGMFSSGNIGDDMMMETDTPNKQAAMLH
eukprot:jgi/Chrzof1/8210/Cz03g01190.t1